MTRLIGINGFKRSGKGTVADLIEDCAPYGMIYQIGFADKLKRFAAATLGFGELSPQAQVALMDEFKITGQLLIDPDASAFQENRTPSGPRSAITGRQFLQEMGVRGRELFGDTFWIDQVLPRPLASEGATQMGPSLAVFVAEKHAELLAQMYPDVDIVAITDLRFENEAERVIALGGEVWEVKRPGTASDGHASEQPLPDELITVTIDNDGSLEDLRVKVEALVAERMA